MTVEFNQANSGSVFKQWNRGLRRRAAGTSGSPSRTIGRSLCWSSASCSPLEADPDIGLAWCESFRADDANRVTLPKRYGDDPLFAHDFVLDGPCFASQHMIASNAIVNATPSSFDGNWRLPPAPQ